MRKIFFITTFLICSIVANATQQMPDYLYFHGKKLDLHTSWGYPSPLQTYFSQNNLKSPFGFYSTANWRGHVAIFEVKDNKLFLNEVQVQKDKFKPARYNIKSNLDTICKNGAVFADWFSGSIVCSDKKQDYYFYVRYGNVIVNQTITEKDIAKIRNISEKDTANHVLMDKYYLLFLTQNYISYYFRLSSSEDYLIIDKQKGHFTAQSDYSPLLEYFDNDHIKWLYNWENFQKNGAPNCRWIIEDDKLYLTDIFLYSGTSFDKIDIDTILITDIFPFGENKNKVFADWTSGIYTFKTGEEKESVIFSAFPEFKVENITYFRIKDGIILEKYTIPANFFKNKPENIEDGLRKILEELELI